MLKLNVLILNTRMEEENMSENKIISRKLLYLPDPKPIEMKNKIKNNLILIID